MNGLRSFWSRVHPYIRKRTILALLIVAGAVALYIAIISMVPEPRTWVTVKATSEYIGFRAANSDLATMRVRGMVARSTSPDDKLEGCVDAIVSPAQGAWVEYRRGGPEYLRIVIDPPANGKIAARLLEAGKEPADLRGSVTFANNAACKDPTPTRFPIWGPATFGEEARPPGYSGLPRPGALMKAAVNVYARAQEKLLGFSFPGAIYSVMTFDAPPGAVLCADHVRAERRSVDAPTCPASHEAEAPAVGDALDADNLKTWTGVATPASPATGFELEATSNAPGLVLRSARTFGAEAPAGRVDLGHHTQLLKDPNLVWLHFTAGAAIFLLQLILSIIAFFVPPEAKQENQAAEGEASAPPVPD